MLGGKAYKIQVGLVLFMVALSYGMSYRVHTCLYRAQKEFERKEYGKAEEILKDCIKKGDHYLLEYLLAGVYMEEKKFGKAEKTFKACISLNSTFPRCWRGLGEVFYKKGLFEKAGEAFLKAYKISKDSNDLYYSSVSLLLANRTSEAFSLLKKLVSSGEPDRSWMEAYIYAGMKLRRYRDVLGVIKRLIRETGDPKWWKVLGDAYVRMGKIDEGAASLLVYSLTGNLTKDDWRFLGDVFSSAGVFEDAAAFYEKSGSGKRCVESLIYAKLYRKAVSKAETFFKKTGDPLYLFLKGRALFEEGRYKEALEAFREAERNDFKDCEMYLFEGACFAYLGNRTQAKRYWSLAEGIRKCRGRARSLMRSLEVGP